jgi:hypothetical protein
MHLDEWEKRWDEPEQTSPGLAVLIIRAPRHFAQASLGEIRCSGV